MLLRTLKSRVGRDEGFALPSVIAIFAIVAIVSLSLAGLAVHALGFSTSTRASVESRAAADSGINVLLTQMQQPDAALATQFPCTLVPGASDIEQYSVIVHYFDASGTVLSCTGAYLPVSSVDPPVRAVADSTGTAAFKGVAGQSAGDTSTVTSVISILVTTADVNIPDMTKSIFSDGGLTLTNATNITDSLAQNSADIYTNGSVECSTSNGSPVQGSIYAQGNVIQDTSCTVQGDVWAGGTYTPQNGNTTIGRNLLVAGGTAAPYPQVSLDSTWVGGDVVTNGPVEASGNGSQANCSLIGAKANVCGSISSMTSTVTLGAGGAVGGDAQAYGDVSIAAGNKTSVYGNVRSVTGNQTVSSTSSKRVVGGYVAVPGAIGLSSSANIGNLTSTCGASAAFGSVSRCPSSPQFSIAALPTEMGYPTQTLVTAPPRESLPTIKSDAAAMSLWTAAGWTITDITNCAIPTTYTGGSFSGKQLLYVTGCGSSPLSLSTAFKLSGDLVIMSPSGFTIGLKNNAITTTGATHQLQLIVPSDATIPGGGNLVTWNQPLSYDTAYYQPVCNSSAPAGYGAINITSNNFSPATNVDMFLYTPCQFIAPNSVGPINGQVYSGTSATGNNESVNYVPMTVPGALKSPTDIPTPVVTTVVTELSRFDARN
ncbi:MAG: hypothetical protein FWD85_12975 [Microbacteriaceae bacterium]|nr:hypothetical protein [Microbacteriaceae bacterium]